MLAGPVAKGRDRRGHRGWDVRLQRRFFALAVLDVLSRGMPLYSDRKPIRLPPRSRPFATGPASIERDSSAKTVASQPWLGYPIRVGMAKKEILTEADLPRERFPSTPLALSKAAAT